MKNLLRLVGLGILFLAIGFPVLIFGLWLDPSAQPYPETNAELLRYLINGAGALVFGILGGLDCLVGVLILAIGPLIVIFGDVENKENEQN